MARKKKLSVQGFTLVEIITVLVVIAGLLIFSYLSIPKLFMRSRDAERKTDLDNLGKGLEEYYASTGCYPAELPACGEPLRAITIDYLDSTPCDPKLKTGYIYVAEGETCNSSYEVYTNLEITEDPSIFRIRCDEGCGPECQYNYGISSNNKPLNTCKPPPEQYACTPSGDCIAFEDPGVSQCPVTFPDDPTCQGKCKDRLYKCHDDRGKKIPD